MSKLILAGVDEVGRGPLVGDVVACAVILEDEKLLQQLTDSKKLSEKKREHFYSLIIENASSYCVGSCSPQEIDKYNILQASLIAMKRSVEGLSVRPDEVLVDGNKLPKWDYKAQAIVKGDLTVPVISAASIVAKVVRDKQMLELDKKYPEYGFAKHKGYPTKAHFEALEKYGPLQEHRKSFGPVARLLESCDLSV